jgi:drug/metabolite transporter (DMT)-like permease
VTTTKARASVALAVAFTLVCWAAAFVGIRLAVRDFSPGPLSFGRYVVASVVLLGWLALTRTPVPAWKDWPRLGVVGLVGITVYNLALNYGEQMVDAGSAAFLVNTAPLFTAIFAVLVLKERVTAVAVGGMVLGLTGAMLLVLGQGKEIGFGSAAVLILVAAVAFSLYFILQKPLLAIYSPLQVVSTAVWIGTVLMVPTSLDIGGELAAAPTRSLVVLVLLGLFPGVLAYVSWSYVLSHIPAARAGSFIYCVAPLTVVIGWVWLDEVPSRVSLAGGLVALVGVFVVNRWGKPGVPREHARPRGPDQ